MATKAAPVPAGAELTFDEFPFLKELGLEKENPGCFFGEWVGSGDVITSVNPTTGLPIARVHCATSEEYEKCLAATQTAKKEWQLTPAPIRGEIVRQVGEAMRKKKAALGALISLEMGKIKTEGQGEVQEFIDICDYATGLSRIFTGLVVKSERKGHFMMENWNPLGTLGLVTAFNFPCAVCGWNSAISLVCGNTQIWKGASTTCLVTLAVTKIFAEVLKANGISGGVAATIVGSGRVVGDRLIADPRLDIVSFTGSTSIGRRISSVVNGRFGRTILELGGNNAMVVMPDANVRQLVATALFAAIGTAGQRCTSLRRLIIHESLYDTIVGKLAAAYATIKIGNPLEDGVLMGPLHTQAAVKEYREGLAEILKQGGRVVFGGKVLSDRPGNFVLPTIVEIDPKAPILKEELFVPILYVLKFKTLEEAIAINNGVPQGLSSSMFTKDITNVFTWLGPGGSDCGIVNVNGSTSGAEIGLAFGGEKETGCGRESGSDSWKQYMKRQTVTINWSDEVRLAQGVKFDL